MLFTKQILGFINSYQVSLMVPARANQGQHMHVSGGTSTRFCPYFPGHPTPSLASGEHVGKAHTGRAWLIPGGWGPGKLCNLYDLTVYWEQAS